MRWKRIKALLIPALLCAGCQTYQAKPLVPVEVFEQVEASRNLLVSAQALSGPEGDRSSGPEGRGFLAAARLMERYGPRLARARAGYDQARSLAEIETPIPDPEIAFGPLVGTSLGPDDSHRVQPLVEFGFAIPLSGRLSAQDDVHRALADEAFVSLVVMHRGGYLELRRLFTEWALAGERLHLQEVIGESARKSLELTRRLVKAGAASALDQGLMELEAAQQEAVLTRMRRERIEVEEALSRLIGISIPSIRSVLEPELPLMETPIPSIEEIKAVMVANNPDLARLRARYEVTEKELRLEIRKQYPDLEIGLSFEGDPGDTKKIWGLAFGVALPLFDRNRQGIAAAESEREKARSEYEAALTESLAALEGLHERYGLATETQRLIRETVLPRSQANLDVALQSIQAGAIDSLKYLEVERTMRALLIEAVQSEWETRKILLDLETIAGVPLVLFPAESAEDFPFIPEREPESDSVDMETSK